MTDETFDPMIREALAALDPERMDPGYWHRLHRWVVNSAGPELARRRRAASTSVSDVVLSWWRTLVPVAGLVAALAGLALMGEEATVQPVAYLSLDESLREGIESPVMPVFETVAPDGSQVMVNEVF